MAEERLLISLDEKVVYHGPSSEAQSHKLNPEDQIFIFPPGEQNLDSGSVVLGVLNKDGAVVPGRYYYPFVASRRAELEKALKDFEALMGQGTISVNKRLELLGRIEGCIHAQVTGPDSLLPF